MPTSLASFNSFLLNNTKTNTKRYANQSGEIFGILGNMKDTFAANLKTAQDEENAAQAAYEGNNLDSDLDRAHYRSTNYNSAN
jgi:hypothetical protein